MLSTCSTESVTVSVLYGPELAELHGGLYLVGWLSGEILLEHSTPVKVAHADYPP